MFDMQQIGKTISALRKARNMTQMELADRLNISFQAVSNWERGQTMPDIAKLGELAEIFGVTIDELLGNGKSAQVVEKLIKEEPIRDELSAEDFLNVAPLVKPSQAEKLWEKVTADVSIKDLIMAAPFIAESVLDGLVLKAAQKEKSFSGLVGLLPFISKEAVDKCMEAVLTDGLDVKKIVAAAPFLGKENLSRLADRILKEGDVKDLVALAPFLKKKKLTEAAAYYAQKDGFSKILPLLPFLDQNLLNEFFTEKWKDKE
jgi:transcriptional regulator with XRE-family HTH domain